MQEKRDRNAYMRDWNAKNREKVRTQKNAKYAALSPEEKTVISQKQRLNFQYKPEVTKKCMLKRVYGLSIEEYNQKKLDQDNKCAICSRELIERGSKRNVPVYCCVDHNHTTGQVRDLLCSNCNGALGLLNEDVVRLTKAIAYLEKF